MTAKVTHLKFSPSERASVELKNWLAGQGFAFDDCSFAWNDDHSAGTMILARHGYQVRGISFKKIGRSQFVLTRNGRPFLPPDLTRAINTAHHND